MVILWPLSDKIYILCICVFVIIHNYIARERTTTKKRKKERKPLFFIFCLLLFSSSDIVHEMAMVLYVPSIHPCIVFRFVFFFFISFPIQEIDSNTDFIYGYLYGLVMLFSCFFLSFSYSKYLFKYTIFMYFYMRALRWETSVVVCMYAQYAL